MKDSHETLETLAEDLERLYYTYHSGRERIAGNLAVVYCPTAEVVMLNEGTDNASLAWTIKRQMRKRIRSAYEQAPTRAERRVVMGIQGFFSYFPDYLTEKNEDYIKRLSNVPTITKMVRMMASNFHYRSIACHIPRWQYQKIRRPTRILFYAYSKLYSPEFGQSQWGWRKSLRIERERDTLQGRIASWIFDDVSYFLPWMVGAFLTPDPEKGKSVRERLNSVSEVKRIFIESTKKTLGLSSH